MATDKNGIITKLDQNWPKDLKNLKSPDWGTVSISSDPVPFDPGAPHQTWAPSDFRKSDNWQQFLTQLRDIPFPVMDTDIGKCLIFQPGPAQDEEGNDNYYAAIWGFPSRLGSSVNFSITGDGVAPAVAFDGSNNVELVLTVNQAAHADNADNAILAQVALQANEANHAAAADVATNAGHADTATNATNAVNATNATNATNAQHAVSADSATNATNATNAQHANTADSATTVSGGITVNLNGDVEGTGSLSGGTINITATIPGASDPGTHSLILGNVKQCWNRGTLPFGGGDITFPDGIAFSNTNYIIIMSVDTGDPLTFSAKTNTGFHVQTDGGTGAETEYNFFIVGN